MVEISLTYYFYYSFYCSYKCFNVVLRRSNFETLCSLQLDRISFQVFHGMRQAVEINAANFCAFDTGVVFMT